MAIQFVGSSDLFVYGWINRGRVSDGLDGRVGTLPRRRAIWWLWRSACRRIPSASLTIGSDDYTRIAGLFANDTNDTNLAVAYKIMGAVPDTLVTVTASTTGRLVAIYVLRGVDETTPMDVAATTATGTNSRVANPPAITPVTTGAVVLAIGANAYIDATFPVFTAPGLTDFVSGSFDGPLDGAIGAGTFAWTSGAYDPAAFTIAGTTTADSWAAFTLALRPAATGFPTLTMTLAAQGAGADTALVLGGPIGTAALAGAETGADAAAISLTVVVALLLQMAAQEAGADAGALVVTPSVTAAIAAAEAGVDLAALVADVRLTASISGAETGADTAVITLSTIIAVLLDLAAQETGADAAQIAANAFVSASIAVAEADPDLAAMAAAVAVTAVVAAIEAGADTAQIAAAVLVAANLIAAEDGPDAAAIFLTIVGAFVAPLAFPGTPASRADAIIAAPSRAERIQ